jgi:hypothetical protein
MSAGGEPAAAEPRNTGAPTAALGSTQDLNDAQCLLVQAYVESGGDVADDAQWDAFMRYTANYKYSLPRGQRRVFELAWHTQDDEPWQRIAAKLQRWGIHVQAASVRKQAMRAAERIAATVRARGWERWLRTAAARPAR